MKITEFFRRTSTSSNEPASSHDSVSVQQEAATSTISHGRAISHRKITDSNDIQGFYRPPFSVTHAALSRVQVKLGELRKELLKPEQFLEKYPEIVHRSVIYELVRDESMSQDIKRLCMARLYELKRQLCSTSTFDFLKKNKGASIGKADNGSLKEVKESCLNQIKSLWDSLEDFEKEPEKWLKQLENFDNEQGLLSLADIFSAYLYLPRGKSKIDWLYQMNVYLTGELQQAEELIKKEAIKTTAKMKKQFKQWQQECNSLGISRLAYMNLDKNGLMGKLFNDNPDLAEDVLEMRLKNLREDVKNTFSTWITRRRKQALSALESLEQCLVKVKRSQADPIHLQTFLNELYQYENKFDKRPFALLLDMAFLTKPGEKEINFLEVTKYRGFLDRASDNLIQEKINNTYTEATPKAIEGLYIPEADTFDHQAISDSSRDVLINDPSTDDIEREWPVTVPNGVLDINAQLANALKHSPEKVQELAMSLIEPPILERDRVILIEPLDSEKKKELFYERLEKPENKTILRGVQKKLIEEALLKQLIMLEPNLVLGMLRSELNNSLAVGHQPQQAATLKSLVSLKIDAPDIAQQLFACINANGNTEIRERLHEAINEHYCISLSQHIGKVHQDVTKVSTAELCKALSAFDSWQLLNNEVIPDIQEQLFIQKQAIERELAWRLIHSEQFTPVKERTYLLACPSRETFINLATRKKNKSFSSDWLSWIISPYSDKKHKTQGSDIIQHVIDNYIPALRKFHEAPLYKNLKQLQQQRFHLLVKQKYYVYSEALRRLEKKHDNTLIPESSISTCKEYLKHIDKIQKKTAPTLPPQGPAELIQGVVQATNMAGDYLSLDHMLDDIEWREQLKALGYDYEAEFVRRTGTSRCTYAEKIANLLNQVHAKATNRQYYRSIALFSAEEKSVNEILKNGIDQALGNLDTLRKVAKRNPVLFRKTVGELVCMLPIIANNIGFSEITASATQLNLQVQQLANEFMRGAQGAVRGEPEELTDEEKELIRGIQFAHDSAIRFMNLQHKMTLIKNAAVTGGKVASTYLGAVALLGPVVGITLASMGYGVSFLSSSASALSPAASKAFVDSISSQTLDLFYGARSMQAINPNALARTTGYIASQAPNMTSDNSSLRRLFSTGKVVLFHIFTPIQALNFQFKVAKKAFYEAIEGKTDGWKAFAQQAAPLAIVVLGGVAAAACAGASVFLVFGMSIGVFAATLGALASTMGVLPLLLIAKSKYSSPIPYAVFNTLQEQLFNDNSPLAKKVKRLCMQQAQTLLSGHLIKSEAFQFLEQQELLRHYYQRYWQQYCQLILKENTASDEDIQEFEHQCEIEFLDWIKKVDISKKANEISQKLKALSHMEGFLRTSHSIDHKNALEHRLKELNIVSVLPTEETAHFVRMLRDELREYIHLECGEIPDITESSEITAKLTQRCKEAFLGNKVRKALMITDHYELENFEVTAKEHFRESHCKRIAHRAEDYIKAIIGELVSPLTLADKARNDYDHAAFETEVDNILKDMSIDDEDTEAFYNTSDVIIQDALKKISIDDVGAEAPYNTAEVIIQSTNALKSRTPITESEDDEFFDAQSEILADAPVTPSQLTSSPVTYDQIKAKLDNDYYVENSGRAELARELIQLQSSEDYIKANMQTSEDLDAMQRALNCSDSEMNELNNYLFKKSLANDLSRQQIVIPEFIQCLLKDV
ncbi:MAG: hypothetical protein PUP46_08160 [Endozoicomonas sp. (ex Botrylloides leachii)]|nr:hypothetical protein [Endozoicomonas sp. (ex Botrylloides leachii)]